MRPEIVRSTIPFVRNRQRQSFSSANPPPCPTIRAPATPLFVGTRWQYVGDVSHGKVYRSRDTVFSCVAPMPRGLSRDRDKSCLALPAGRQGLVAARTRARCRLHPQLNPHRRKLEQLPPTALGHLRARHRRLCLWPEILEMQSSMPTLKAGEGCIYVYRVIQPFGAAIVPSVLSSTGGSRALDGQPRSSMSTVPGEYKVSANYRSGNAA